MKRRFRKKHIPFVTLSKHKRRDEVIKLKGKIKRDTQDYGGQFTSHLVLDEPGRPDLYNQWFSFYFLGKDRSIIWNAYIITARQAAWNQARDMAYDKMMEIMTPEEQSARNNLDFFMPADVSSTGKIISYTANQKRKSMQFDSFGGLTFSEQWDKLESEILRESPPTIYESFKLDHDYAYGIGLHIVIDTDVINQTTIEQAIAKFREIGETDWQATNPVPRERLPVVSLKEALAELGKQ